MSILAYYRIQTTNKEIICPTHPHQRKKSSNGLIIFLVAVMLIVLGAVIYIWVDVSNAQRQQQQLDDLSSQIEQTKTKNDTSAQEAENQPPTESESNDGNSSPADLENPTDTTITEPN